MTQVTMTHPEAAGAAVVDGPRRARRSTGGAPPERPPEDHGGGGGGGGGSEGQPAANAGADGAGPFALALTLIGITTLFLVLILVWFFLRRPAPDWRALGGTRTLDALWVSTACLVASSLALERAVHWAGAAAAPTVSALSARRPSARRATVLWLGASLVLGLAFLAAQVSLWIGLAHAGFVPASGGYAAIFFALTGLHALHVLGGLGFLASLALRSARPRSPLPSVRLGAIYWHYMGALWLVLFALLYFVR